MIDEKIYTSYAPAHASKVTERDDYEGGYLIYRGIAPRGTVETSPGWNIEKYIYVNHLPTQILQSPKGSIWANRTTTEYA
jgi:hypothetical protein